MIFLLDVNALVALGLEHHSFNTRMNTWLMTHPTPMLATSAITELGFVRVISQAAAYNVSLSRARTMLIALKNSPAFANRFIADTHDISHLPPWAKSPKQVTDAHLSQLAIANGARLATLDEKIPGSFLIPH